MPLKISWLPLIAVCAGSVVGHEVERVGEQAVPARSRVIVFVLPWRGIGRIEQIAAQGFCNGKEERVVVQVIRRFGPTESPNCWQMVAGSAAEWKPGAGAAGVGC